MNLGTQEENATVSSEVIEDPDEPASSCQRADSDEDWLPTDGKRAKKSKTFSVENIPQKEWIKSIIPAANRAQMSSDEIFYVFGDFFSAHGVNIRDLIFSPSTITQVRTEFETENAAKIKVNPVRLIHL